MVRMTNHRLTEARKAAGLTQTQLGDLCGVSAAAVSEWENGKSSPTVERVDRVLEALSATYEDIFGRVAS